LEILCYCNEDDAVAIVTRRLVKESDILKGMVSNTLGSKQLNPVKKNKQLS
jgi:DNA sulfur modification protein DndB